MLREHHGFETEIISNEKATARSLRSYLKKLAHRVRENDRVIFYFAGHGTAVESKNGPKGYLLPHDADPRGRRNHLPMAEVEQAPAALRCRHLLVILDFAVPYSDSDLRSMLTSCGYVCFSKNILFGTGAGYFVSAKITDASLDPAAKIRQIIRRHWRVIKQDLVRQYAAMGPVPTDFSGYRNRLQALNTIASIDADQEGLWH